MVPIILAGLLSVVVSTITRASTPSGVRRDRSEETFLDMGLAHHFNQ
jgi:hypothetical protein